MKKVVIALLVLVMTLALAACGCEHEEVVDPAVPATCTQAGKTEGKHCSLCGDTLVAQNAIPATGHTEEAVAAVDATCTTTGSTEGKKCTVCGVFTVGGEEIPATGHTEEVIAAVDATCTASGNTEGKKCTDCGEVLVEAEQIAPLGHTTTTGTCTRCNTSFGIFSIGYYVDEFNQPTSDGYVVNESYVAGTFSNSATTDSLLYVQVLADGEDITIFLYEYGKNLVKNSSSRYVEEYDITMKTADGTKHSLTGTIYCGGDRLFIDDRYMTTVLEALKSGEQVSFYIVQSERTTTTYLFTVSTSNFAEKYEALFG